jgi:HEAT repeat protein
MNEDKIAGLEGVINGESVLVLGDISDKEIRRLKQLVRSGEPAARIVAVKALAQTGDFDHVPTLLYALADPDPRLAIEARDGLRFVSRRFDGFGPPDRFNRQEQLEAVDKWVRWYQGVRPDVPVVLE